jgi:hypothetical protein
MKVELTKVGMFIEGIIMGVCIVYSFLYGNPNIDLPIYPIFIGLLCMFCIGLAFNEEVKE